jgi:hypothetical protein
LWRLESPQTRRGTSSSARRRKLPNVDQADVPQEKVTGYLLKVAAQNAYRDVE